jgi:hypothetical protein
VNFETKDGNRKSIKEILELSRISNAPFSVGFIDGTLDI